MKAGEAYPVGPHEFDQIQVRVGTRDRLRQLRLGSYDETIAELLRGYRSPAYDQAAQAAAAGGGPRKAPAAADERCASVSPRKIRGAPRACRVRGPHDVHRFWSPNIAGVTW